MKNRYPTLVSLSLLSVLNLASAAPVTFKTGNFPQTGGDYSLLDAGGTVLEAATFTTATFRANPFTNTNPDPAATLNGIAFTPVAFLTNVGGAYYVTNGAGTDSNRVSGTDYATSKELYDLSYDVLRTGGNNINLTATLQNLQVGTNYMVQFIFSADNLDTTKTDRKIQVAAGVFTPSVTWTTAGSGADGTSTILTYGPTSGVGLVTANFTADQVTEAFTFLSNTTFSNQGNNRVSLAGIVVSIAPDQSVLKILSSAFNTAAGTLDLTFASTAGKTYQITQSQDLVTWTQTGADISATAAQTSTQVSFTPAAARFFRVELKP